MALYDNLPVFKVSYDLLRRIYRICSTMERCFRFTLGERLQNDAIEILKNIYRANNDYEKAPYIKAAREHLEVVRLLLRVAHEEKQISMKHYVEVCDLVESISKQLAAWQKSLGLSKEQGFKKKRMSCFNTKYKSLIEWEFVRAKSAQQRGSINSANHQILVKKDRVCYFFLPAAGYRNNSNGALNNRGTNGNYWSSRMNDATNAYNANFNSGNANMNNNNRANGQSIRCIAEFIINK